MTAFFSRIFSRHPDRWLAAALWALAFALYLCTLCPTIYWGDCGELVSAAFSLGITHPTGYPVWCLLAKAWMTLLPFGDDPGWRLGTMSAFFGAIAAASLFGFARACALPRPVALAAAGFFAVSQTFWQQCLLAETYSLTAAYTTTLLFLAARWRARGCRAADLTLLAVVYGFALTNHQINTLFVPGFLIFVLTSEPALRRLKNSEIRRRWLVTLSLGLTPLLFYAYLPLRAQTNPTPNWGDPQTPFAFFYHVTGRAYAHAMFHSAPRDVLTRIGNWATHLGGEYSYLLVATAIFGLILLWKRDKSLAALLTWILTADIIYTTNYNIYNAYIYFIPSYICIAALAGFGVTAAWQRIEKSISDSKRQSYARLAAACLVLCVPAQAVGHGSVNNLSSNWTCLDYARNLLASAPPNALLINGGAGSDTSEAAINYVQRVLGERRDVALLNRGILGAVFDQKRQRWANVWYLEQFGRHYAPVKTLYPHGKMTANQALEEDPLRRLIAQAVASGRPVVLIAPEDGPKIFDGPGDAVPFAKFLDAHYDRAQIGLLAQLWPKGKRPTPNALLAESRRARAKFSLRGVYDGLYLSDDFLTPMALDYFNADISHARLAASLEHWAEADDAYTRAARLFRSKEADAGRALCAAHLPKSLPKNPQISQREGALEME